MPGQLQPSDVIHLGLGGGAPWDWAPATFRVIEVLDPKDSYRFPGTVWLAVYQLDENGHATARREIYTQLAGIQLLHRAVPAARRPVNGGPTLPRIPAQRRPATTSSTTTGRTR